MAALTWREVAAPDLSTSLRGYEGFTRTLNTALGGLRDTVEGIDQQNIARDSQGLMLEALQAQDPEAIRALAAGANPGRINAQAIAMLGARPAQLLQEQNAAQALEESRYGFAQDKAGDALAPTFMQASSLARAGNAAGAQALYEANKDQFGAAGLKTSQAFTKALQDAEEFGVDITGKRQDQALDLNRDQRDNARLGMEQGRYNFEVEDRADARAADGYLANVLESVDPSNIETVRNAVFNGGLSKAPASVRAAVYGRVSQQFPGLFSPEQFGMGTGSNGAVPAGSVDDPSRVMNYQARAAGFNSVPDSVKTLGDASKFALAVNKAGVESSAMGTFQIVGRTLRNYAPKVLGKDWQSQPFTQANQEKIAQAIFNDHKGSADALRKQWVSLSPADAERVRKMPWPQARQEIAARESGASARAFGGSTPAVMMGAALRQGQDRAGRSSASELIGVAGGPTNPLDIVDSLKTVERFKDTSKEFLTTQLNSIVNRSKVNGQPTITPAQAGVILRDAARVNNNSWDITNYLGNNSVRINKAGDRLDNSYIEQEVARARSGNGLVNDAVREVDTAQATAQLQAAQDQAARAASALASAERRAVTQPALQAQLPLLRASAAAAASKLQQVRTATERLNRPIQQPVAQSTGSPSGGGFFDGLFSIRRTGGS